MNNKINSMLVFLIILLTYNPTEAQNNSQSRQSLLMDLNWKFQLGDQKAEAIDYDDSKWRSLNLPHDWSIEGE